MPFNITNISPGVRMATTKRLLIVRVLTNSASARHIPGTSAEDVTVSMLRVGPTDAREYMPHEVAGSTIITLLYPEEIRAMAAELDRIEKEQTNG